MTIKGLYERGDHTAELEVFYQAPDCDDRDCQDEYWLVTMWHNDRPNLFQERDFANEFTARLYLSGNAWAEVVR